jgi:hypothetical protein
VYYLLLTNPGFSYLPSLVLALPPLELTHEPYVEDVIDARRGSEVVRVNERVAPIQFAASLEQRSGVQQDVVRKRPTRLGLESGHTLPMGRGVDVWARWRGRLVHDARSDASSRASHSLEVEAVHRVQPSVEHDHRWLQASDDRVEEAF